MDPNLKVDEIALTDISSEEGISKNSLTKHSLKITKIFEESNIENESLDELLEEYQL